MKVAAASVMFRSARVLTTHEEHIVQEPDDQFLGNQIVGSCSAYLQTLVNARALSSYDVVSDASNNSASDLNSGIRNVTVKFYCRFYQ
jgi:phage tail sheath protein FI